MDKLHDLWQQRYGGTDGLPTGLPTDLSSLAWLAHLMAHRSVRAYQDKPLPEHTLPAMLAAAQSAASSSNLQAFSVVAVQDPARKAKLAECAGHQTHIRQAPLLLVWLADLSRLDRNAARQGLPAEANGYLEMFLVAVVDAALAAQNAVLAAEAMGLGTVYIGAMRNQPLAVAEVLNLPPDVFALFGLCVGWPDPQRPAAIKPRLPQALVLHHETYAHGDAAGQASQAEEARQLTDYDAAMQRFQKGQGMPATDWTLQTAQRVAGPGSLSGRDVLAEVLKSRGFGLR